MKMVIANFVAIVGLAAVAFAPESHADPVPGPVYDLVCPTLDNDPSVRGVRGMMLRDTALLFNANVAWETIVDASLNGCPQHLPLLKQYATFYGGH